MRKKSVLLVDDSSDLLALQKMILERDGFEVLTARSAGAAFELLALIDEPSLIILDQQMEDMSGSEFLEALELKSPEILEKVPVVFLSGAEPPRMSRAIGYIQKFPDIDVYLERVNHFIEMGVGLRELDIQLSPLAAFV